MPGRIASTRSARTASASTTATVASTATATTTPATSAKPKRAPSVAALAAIPDDGPITELRKQVCAVFADAQRYAATQRKHAIRLRRIQESVCMSGADAPAEQAFGAELGRCLLRILAIRKGETAGDRLVKFVALFLSLAGEKDGESVANSPSGRLAGHLMTHVLLPFLEAKDKTIRFRSTQLVSQIVNALDSIEDDVYRSVKTALLRRLRDKEVSVRVHAFVGLARLAGDGDVDGDTDASTGTDTHSRHTKDADASNDDEADDDDRDTAYQSRLSTRGHGKAGRGGGGGDALLARLIEVLQHDPAAEVRRTALLNMPLVPATLPLLLERARDVDAGTRKGLYARLLPSLGDFRHLSLTHREKLLRWGLRDRDEAVQKAAARLFRERWIEDCASTSNSVTNTRPGPADQIQPTAEIGVGQDGKDGKGGPNYDALLELLERIDVVNSGVEGGIALEAMHEFWQGRPDYCDMIEFDDSFWDSLSAESAFVVRSFNSFCRQAKETRYQAMLDEKLPEVTKFAFITQKQINSLVELVRKAASAEEGDDGDAEAAAAAATAEEDAVQQEFVVEQLLHMALTLDYTDEIGRRKIFSVMREALALAELPEECTKLTVEVLRTVCGSSASGERDFCSIVLEGIAEVHDTIVADEVASQAADDSFHSAQSEVADPSTPPPSRRRNGPSADGAADNDDDDGAAEAQALREMMVNMKCLHIAQCMLQNVECRLEENSHLTIMVDNLVIPAVRSQEAPIRERGLLALGLCCLLSLTLARENLGLFLHCFNKGHEALQRISLETICDILLTHPSLVVVAAGAGDSEAQLAADSARTMQKAVQKAFGRALRSPDGDVQCAGATALSKLLLVHAVHDADLLGALALAYFDPDSADKPALRQALAYFLPVFCRSQAANAARMAAVAVPLLRQLSALPDAEEEELGDADAVALPLVAAHLADWTDARKIVASEGRDDADARGRQLLASAVLDMAEEALVRIGSPSCSSKDEKRALATLVAKLFVASDPPPPGSRMLELATLAVEASVHGPDATTRNALVKVGSAWSRLAAAGPGSGIGDNETTARRARAGPAGAISDIAEESHHLDGDSHHPDGDSHHPDGDSHHPDEDTELPDEEDLTIRAPDPALAGHGAAEQGPAEQGLSEHAPSEQDGDMTQMLDPNDEGTVMADDSMAGSDYQSRG